MERDYSIDYLQVIKQKFNLDEGVIAINMPQDTNDIDPLKYWVWADYVPPGNHSLIIKGIGH